MRYLVKEIIKPDYGFEMDPKECIDIVRLCDLEGKEITTNIFDKEIKEMEINVDDWVEYSWCGFKKEITNDLDYIKFTEILDTKVSKIAIEEDLPAPAFTDICRILGKYHDMKENPLKAKEEIIACLHDQEQGERVFKKISEYISFE